VRIFPSASRSRATAATAVCALALASMAIPFASARDDHLKHTQKQVHHAVRSAAHDLDESSSALRAATAKLQRARDQLGVAQGVLHAAQARVSAARLRDQEMQAQLAAAVARLSTARTDLVTGQQNVQDQRDHVANTITDYYEQGDPTLLGLASVLNAENPADITRRLSYMDTVVGQETQAYDDLHASEVLLTVRETQVETAKDAVAQRRRDAAEHLVEMQGLEAEAQTAAASVHRLVRASAVAKREALTVRRADLQTLKRLKAREDRIKQRILAAAKKDKGGYHGDTNGLLNKPVDGPVTSPYGWRIHPIYGYWGLHDGTDFGAGCGQHLWAVAGGTVLEEYYSSVWGNRLYLNLGNFNGKNVTVIYNHMSGYRVSTGEHVSRGETVGYVGTTGWSTGCHLHFTVMVNGETVDPMGWIGS
jgi:murein DD-endopeptidase MepM/ murein hydrolase activator NlpD